MRRTRSEVTGGSGDAAALGGGEHEGLVDLAETSRLSLEFGDLLHHLSRGELEIADVGRGWKEQSRERGPDQKQTTSKIG